MATAAAAASGLRVMTTQRGPARADDDTPPKEPPAHAHRHRAATEPLPRMRIRLGDGVPAQRSAAQPARTAGGERSARRDLLGRWGGGAVVMAAVSGAVGSEIRSKMRRNNGIGAERGGMGKEPKSCGPWSSTQLAAGHEWFPPGLGTGAAPVEHLYQWHLLCSPPGPPELRWMH